MDLLFCKVMWIKQKTLLKCRKCLQINQHYLIPLKITHANYAVDYPEALLLSLLTGLVRLSVPGKKFSISLNRTGPFRAGSAIILCNSVFRANYEETVGSHECPLGEFYLLLKCYKVWTWFDVIDLSKLELQKQNRTKHYVNNLHSKTDLLSFNVEQLSQAHCRVMKLHLCFITK